jgi:hypothetical protein
MARGGEGWAKRGRQSEVAEVVGRELQFPPPAVRRSWQAPPTAVIEEPYPPRADCTRSCCALTEQRHFALTA